ncbi:MAG: hypothetical protein FWF49_05895 [Oscillospiraceae bacterium]|nr:hypothetical protein [Oscillospiraceae bacterium]
MSKHKYTNPKTVAENSGNLKISKRMLRAACPDMFGTFGMKIGCRILYKRMCEFMMLGDAQPAIVWSLSPFLIAAYSDEMDAVVMVRFNSELAKKYGIVKGQHMISINVYLDGKRYGWDISEDIKIGSGYLGRWIGFHPHIGDLLSDNTEIIEKHKKNIPEET